MNNFKEYINQIENKDHQQKLITVLNWVIENYPNLETKVAWNQPMFTDHGTFILAFSVAKDHFAVAPEYKTMRKFESRMKKNKYNPGMMFMRIKWDVDVDYQLLKDIIDYNIEDKKDCQTFWRKKES